jgi:hypothetical protein
MCNSVMSLTAKVAARFRLSECVHMFVELKSLMMSSALTHTKAIWVIIYSIIKVLTRKLVKPPLPPYTNPYDEGV